MAAVTRFAKATAHSEPWLFGRAIGLRVYVGALSGGVHINHGHEGL